MRAALLSAVAILTCCRAASSSSITPPLFEYPAVLQDTTTAGVAASVYDGNSFSDGGEANKFSIVPGINYLEVYEPVGVVTAEVVDLYGLTPLVWAIAAANIPPLDIDTTARAGGNASGTLNYTVEAVGPPGKVRWCRLTLS
jgi:hypothetical protein